MAEDDWSKKRRRSEDSSSDESSQYSSACESRESEESPEKTSSIFDISPQSDSCKSTLLKARTKDLGFMAMDSASCSGLSKRKCHKEVTKGVKRRLWDVDRDQVDLDLDRELKRMHKEETLEKSAKWNFDFEREAPLSGEWSWYSTQSAPHFYQSKDITSKFKKSQPPTISKWSPKLPSIQSTAPTHSSVIRPKPIRSCVSKPAAIKITFEDDKEPVKGLKSISSGTLSIVEMAEKISIPARLDIKASSVTDTTTGDSESETVSSSSTCSSSAKVDRKRRKLMTLRPRKRQMLERKKSSQLKRFR